MQLGKRLIMAMAVALLTAFCAGAHKLSTPLDSCLQLYDNGRWLEALSALTTYTEHAPGDSDPRCMAEANMLIGNIYSGYDDFENSIRYFDSALKVAERHGLRDIAVRASANAAVNASYKRDKDKADYYMVVFRRNKGATRDTYDGFLNVIVNGFYERSFGTTERAKNYMRQALSMTRNGSIDSSKRIIPLSELMEMYAVTGPVDSAMQYIKLTEAEARREKQIHVQVTCMRLFKELYAEQGMVDSAMIYEQRQLKLRDSLLNTQRFITLSGTNTAARDERNLARIDGLNVLVNRQWTALLTALFVIVIITLSAVIIFTQKRKLSHAYRALWTKNQELEHLRDITNTPLSRDLTPKKEPSCVAECNPVNRDLERRISEIMENGREWLNPDFSLQMLADLAESNTKYVSQVINDVYGKNFRSFINDYRIREARRIMAQPDTAGRLTLQTIGESVGFRGASNFIAAFKKQTGLTPSIYMKMQAEEGKNHTNCLNEE